MSEAFAKRDRRDATDLPSLHETPSARPESIELSLTVTDPELVDELAAYPRGRPRDEIALSALRIGILALRQAQGRLDANAVRTESDRLMGELARRLGEHQQAVTQQLAGSLKDYFDPDSGRLNERIERLVRKDGELELMLRRQVGVDDSELAKTLAAHMGEQSPLMKVLSPDQSKGILGALSRSIDGALGQQRQTILREFSLDNKDGALSRLVGELGERHGKLSKDLRGSIENVVGEFSLDNEESALSRLVRRVERAQKQISSEFSLDEETSALARMKRELLDVLESQRKASAGFQEEVRSALAAMAARKEEALRSTRHGEDFEEEVFRMLQREGQKAGDVTTHTGATTGRIKNCKVGDCVIELGRESAAAGARIVVEAKQSGSYNLSQALGEMETARKNRDARVGLFVFSERAAPEGLQSLARYGSDVVVVWDADDPRSDVFLAGGLSVARALCARARVQHEAQEADFESIDRAIREIEKQSGGLDEIVRYTGTIRSNSEKILSRARIMQDALRKQIEVLDEMIEDLETTLDQEESGG